VELAGGRGSLAGRRRGGALRTGNPYFTTDTAAALRALELDADVLLMAKNRVDGVYSDDPNRNAEARRYRQISHQEAIERDLRVMDASALALCRENDLPILVFNMANDGAIVSAVRGEPVGTLVATGPARLEE
jgi:uridylate kinase